MDYAQIISETVKILPWLVLAAIIIGLLHSTWCRGVPSKAMVTLTAKLKLPANTYRQLHNISLPTRGGMIPIEHIVVSRYGIFLVEIQNRRGWIFGDKNQPQWVQKIAKKFIQFKNPLQQNRQHVKALQAVLTVPEKAIHPVVVFVGNNTFKTPMPDNVVRGGAYIEYIKSFRKVVLSTNEVQIAFAEIESGNRCRWLHSLQIPMRSQQCHRHPSRRNTRLRRLFAQQ